MTILCDKVTVITGAASGIGKSILARFLKEGHRCLAADFDESGLIRLQKEYDGNSNLSTFRVDVSDSDQVDSMVDYAVAELGDLDIIVNNAGIMDNLLPIAELDNFMWQRVLSVNLNSVMFGTRKAVQYYLAKGKKGVIVNTASLSGLQGGRGGLAYTASKFGVVGITKNTAFMYADQGIRCNCVCPAAVTTNINATGNKKPSELGLKKATSGISGASRSANPEEIASVAYFLASDEAKFINGAAIVVDDAWSAY